MNFEQRVINSRHGFTELEEDIVAWILKNKEEAASIKIVTLATQLYTAPNTIMRLCRKLGYDGFTELKVELKHELQEQVENETKRIFLRNFELIDAQRELEVVKLFQRYPKVNFFALEQAVVIAKACTEHFYTLSDKFRLYQYENELVNQIENNQKSCFFFISLSGESTTVHKLARLAKEYGHKVVSLTNLTENTLSDIADVNLYCYTTREVYGYYDVTDKTPLMLIMHSLYRAYLESLNQELIKADV
ncbi:SIS domain-containing protein [Lactococcus garvieae]|nr:SIS domain-containing protein [Lactococcus garvieae]